MNPLSRRDLPERISQWLKSPLPGAAAQSRFAPELSYGRHQSPPPQGARRAAVVLLMYPTQDHWRLPLTVRPETLSTHAGQISFPGGEIEGHETVEQAALRELSEELDVGPTSLKLLGRLTPIYVFASNFVVMPCLAAAACRPEFCPNPAEVANLLEPKLVELLDHDRHGKHQIRRRGVCFQAPHIEFQGNRIWGATSMILAEFLAVIDQAVRRDAD